MGSILTNPAEHLETRTKRIERGFVVGDHFQVVAAMERTDNGWAIELNNPNLPMSAADHGPLKNVQTEADARTCLERVALLAVNYVSADAERAQQFARSVETAVSKVGVTQEPLL